MKHLVMIVMAGLVCVSGAMGAVIFVDDDAPPGGDGQSWQTAFKCLQDALWVAQSGDEVRVAQGTYLPDRDEAGLVTLGDRAATFTLVDGAAVLGGYAGLTGPDPNYRDIANQRTVLSGDIGVPGTIGDNSFHVATAIDVGPDTALDGVEIAKGYTSDTMAGDRQNGAGVFMRQASPTLRNCTIRGNQTAALASGSLRNGGEGAGVYCNGGAPAFMGCSIDQNSTAGGRSGSAQYSIKPGRAGDGGGMFFLESSPRFVDCTFTSNYTGSGGSGGGWHASCQEGERGGHGAAVVLDGCSQTDFLRCQFFANRTGCGGNGGQGDPPSGCSGGDAGHGGALYLRLSSVNLADCEFNANRTGLGGTGAPPYGGGGHGGSGGAIYAESSTLTIIGATMHGQVTGDGAGGDTSGGGGKGGAICAYESTLEIVDSKFTSNVAGNAATGSDLGNNGGFGGAVYARGPGAAVLKGCLLTNNRAGRGGDSYGIGYIPMGWGGAGGCGGALYAEGLGHVTLTNCLLADNRAGDGGNGYYSSHYNVVGGAAGAGGGVWGTDTPLALINCTAVNNAAGQPGTGTPPGAVGATGGVRIDGTSSVFSNAILWGNRGASPSIEIQQIGGQPTINYSCVEGWTGNLGGTGNTGADPQFQDPNNGNYRLVSGSPCVDAGDNTAVPSGIETDLDGNPRFVDDPHTPNTGHGTPPIVDMGAYELQVPALPVLLVSSMHTDTVLAYDGAAGVFVRRIAAASSGLHEPNGIIFDGQDSFYVASVGTQSVLKYSLTTGQLKMEFTGGGLNGPVGLYLTSNDSLLVASYFTDSVKEFDLATGLWVRDFVPVGSGGLLGPAAIVARANGNLLVASQRGDQVLEYDGQSGQFIGLAAAGGGLSAPAGLVCDAEGNLLVASFNTDQVLKYAPNGAFLGVFVAAGSGGLDGAEGLTWSASGNLLVANRFGHNVLEFDRQTGSFVRVFAHGGELAGPTYLAAAAIRDPDCNGNGRIDQWDIDLGASTDLNGNRIPDECEPVGDLNCDGHKDFGDINPFVLALTNPAGYAQQYPNCDRMNADINGDGQVGFGDINPFVKLLLH